MSDSAHLGVLNLASIMLLYGSFPSLTQCYISKKKKTLCNNVFKEFKRWLNGKKYIETPLEYLVYMSLTQWGLLNTT